MASRWDFRTILDVDPDEDRTCVGIAKTYGRRCRNPISMADRESASSILDDMDHSKHFSSALEHLEELACLMLCKGVHNNHKSRAYLSQVDEVEAKWTSTARRYYVALKKQKEKDEAKAREREKAALRKLKIRELELKEARTQLKTEDIIKDETNSLHSTRSKDFVMTVDFEKRTQPKNPPGKCIMEDPFIETKSDDITPSTSTLCGKPTPFNNKIGVIYGSSRRDSVTGTSDAPKPKKSLGTIKLDDNKPSVPLPSPPATPEVLKGDSKRLMSKLSASSSSGSSTPETINSKEIESTPSKDKENNTHIPKSLTAGPFEFSAKPQETVPVFNLNIPRTTSTITPIPFRHLKSSVSKEFIAPTNPVTESQEPRTCSIHSYTSTATQTEPYQVESSQKKFPNIPISSSLEQIQTQKASLQQQSTNSPHPGSQITFQIPPTPPPKSSFGYAIVTPPSTKSKTFLPARQIHGLITPPETPESNLAISKEPGFEKDHGQVTTPSAKESAKARRAGMRKPLHIPKGEEVPAIDAQIGSELVWKEKDAVVSIEERAEVFGGISEEDDGRNIGCLSRLKLRAIGRRIVRGFTRRRET